VNKALTLRSTSGASSTFLNATGLTIPVLLAANNVVMDSFSLYGANWGIFAGDISNATNYSNVQVRNMSVDTAPSAGSPNYRTCPFRICDQFSGDALGA
jgi:hypothetical protein